MRIFETRVGAGWSRKLDGRGELRVRRTVAMVEKAAKEGVGRVGLTCRRMGRGERLQLSQLSQSSRRSSEKRTSLFSQAC